MKVFLIILSFLLQLPTILFAQEVVYLKNPSFEDVPKYGAVPGAWRNCAFNHESPPDIHPIENGRFGVKQQPIDGDTYIGLVARDNNTTESLGQQLLSPLKGGQCYSLNMMLCRSEKLMSRSRATGEIVNFSCPITLRIWGGLSPCGKKVQLAVSPEVDHTDWKNYSFHFQSAEDLTWLLFEANYSDGTTQPCNGNILIDNASAIIPVSCDNHEALVNEADIVQPAYDYVNYTVPKNVRSKTYYSAFGSGGYFMDFRVVDNPSDINGLILDNCPGIGFEYSTHLLTDELGIGLKEVAVNVARHENTTLVLGVPDVGKMLVNKRSKKLRRIFREIDFPKNKYQIVVLPPNWEGEGWLCGSYELWLKLVVE